MVTTYHEFKVRRALREVVKLRPAAAMLTIGLVFSVLYRGTATLRGNRLRYNPDWVVSEPLSVVADELGNLLSQALPPLKGQG